MHHDIRMTARKIAARLALIEPLERRRKRPLQPFRFAKLDGPADEPLPDLELEHLEWQTILPGTYWGARDVNFILLGEFVVPRDFDPHSPVALFLPLGDAGDFSHPEALVYIDGVPYAAADRHHQELQLAERHRDGNPHQLALYGWTGLLGGDAALPEPGKQLLMRECAVVQIDSPTREFLAAARTALQAANFLTEIEPAKARLYNALDAALKLLDTREPFGDAFYDSIPSALETLREGIANAGAPFDAEIIAAGHAHIDVAWLWTLGQTRRKAGRSFHTAIRLMEQFPDFSFTQSQPQLYSYIQKDYPDLFDAIKERVAEGRWEPIGGMWVEADCNITGSESLARQFLLGRAYFREHFGKDAESPVLWLPDVFGYAWNLPQLIKLAGMDYFFTIKIGWNQVNKMPFDSFWWQGLDGTRVLTHFSTAPGLPWRGGDPNLMDSASYNASLSAFSALGAWVKLQHKESQNVLLMSYGYGDGGGGPTREMNENALELRAFPAVPRVTQGKVIDFFRRLEAESGDKLPSWNSELYLEIHRGTYTTQSRNKRANRKSEFLLHDAEFIATFASLLDSSYNYPRETFRDAWELVCLNQFHDIIPGSSINAVYVESQSQYDTVRSMGEAARDTALDILREKVGGDIAVINPTGFQRSDPIFWENELPAEHSFGGEIYTQPVQGGTLLGGLDLEPYSVRSLQLTQLSEGDAGPPVAPPPPLHVDPTLLENAYIRVELNEAGDITRIFDKEAEREVLPQGAVANQFQAFEDRPVDWDAWDIDIFYDDKMFLAEPAELIRVVESGPLRATIEITRRILNSRYTQRISLLYNSPQISFTTTIDWRERHILLKTSFPIDALSPVATYEIQWGSVQRPTHRNTSWDWARFETCAQKWVDLSEGDYGVSLLNDCKYGHDIRDNVMRISLLRAPTHPDPEADQGEHLFAYSLFPHSTHGGRRITNADIAQQAYLFNDPAIAVRGSTLSANDLPSLVTVAPNAIIETIKRAEDGNGVVARFYECNRSRGWVTIETGFPLKAAEITNLLEEYIEDLSVSGQSAKLYLKPFQIVTVRLIPA